MTKKSNTKITTELILSESEKDAVLEWLWLTYYNDTLYSKGVISKTAHACMQRKIRDRALDAKT